MKHDYFRVISITLLILCFSATGITLFAREPLKGAAFVIACLFWLLLPLTIFQELSYRRYHRLSRMFQSNQH